MTRRSLPPQVRARGVTAVLGPTNTGKTHLAIERMLGHETGMIGLPLRLLAREVYQRVVEKAGAHNVALVTGEEKIKPDRPRYWISTVEAMPRDLDLAFVAVDEIQLAADLDRGHVFTDRLLNQRGREETLLIGSNTMRPLIEALIPGVHVVTRPRLSQLTFAGEKKVSRLPRRTAIVAFSAEEVYAIAELIRRQRGGAAVVLGALSPRTRNAQVELYQSGDVEYLVATDAVGMGLNLDVDHVAFAADRKYDGFRFRKLYPAELAQIAGRAGRHMRDGTFGTAGRCPPFDAETVEALENHTFDPVRIVQWRNPDLDFSSLGRLRDSLSEQPREYGLVRAPMGEDVAALEVLAREDDIQAFGRSKVAVERLWQVCQVPDYRKVSPQTHADLVGQLYRFLMKEGSVPADWFSRHLLAMDRTDGDIDTLSNRIAQVRTWSFVANRPDWLKDPEHWQGVARQVEDKLSDALHERLAQRFIDRRTSVLMRRLRENTMLDAEITTTGDVTVEGQHIGHLHGFHFVPDPQADTAEAKTLRNAASKALAGEIEARADRFAETPDTMLVLSNDGTIRWMGDPVAKLEPGDKLFEPRLRILSDEQLTGPARDKVDGRLRAWLKAYVVRLLGPLMELEHSQELTGLARGIAFQIVEALGVLERAKVLNDVRSLDQEARGALRKAGIRFGAYHLYLPALLKPAPRILSAQLWALQNGGLDQKGIDEIAHLAQSGRTSIPVDKEIAAGLYRAAGFRVCGDRAVRVDILERLADLIRPAIAYRPGVTPGEPPAGAADGETFVPTVAMTSLVGCAGDDFATILKSLGYVMERRPGPAITVPLVPAPQAVVAVPATAEGGPVAEMPAEASAEVGRPTEAALESVEASAFVPPEAPVAVEAPAAAPDAAPTVEVSAEVPAEAASETPVETPAEPEMVEVWRQHRRHHEGGHARQGRGRQERGERRPRQGDQRQGEQRHGEQPSGERPPRPDRRPERREASGEGGRPQQGRHSRGPGRPDERRGPPRHGKGFEPRRDAGHERRERQPDPDSPFAKLMALKAQLEDSKK
ncbi:helicase-related protein [Microvirga sp. 17 mud 1-3]|uniref:helicase-related protein n=1 Tax=Microvirga sp. 17 mud 1-3 TaxID=2082949 RepID=UPI000D6AC699|nr:helicase-related protein [Microvirga sp. 17 mud 1-3]AWM88939.1 helicase [Microvirga sp. 17 mud 1-3]